MTCPASPDEPCNHGQNHNEEHALLRIQTHVVGYGCLDLAFVNMLIIRSHRNRNSDALFFSFSLKVWMRRGVDGFW